ncbi:Sporozoite surface protein 2 [Lasiodiplodia hormozganensis]|uniref:Sporozoite surface protein 2 n=1 Tax=Lasiodiplodia hormozganensis TaxID=869390 RepID=A0AA39XY42_9PEZI|nr:Sporozoite surface protein 2 [Lasiodiplodia hormozganensis]
MPKGTQVTKNSENAKDPQNPQNTKNAKDHPQHPQNTKNTKDPKNSQDPKNTGDPKNARDPQNPKESSSPTRVVFGTARAETAPASSPEDITWLPSVAVSSPDADFPSYDAQATLYKTSAIAPTLIVSALTAASLLRTGSKVILVSSESSSITMRHKIEGGGKYDHRASTTALNMVGKILCLT